MCDKKNIDTFRLMHLMPGMRCCVKLTSWGGLRARANLAALIASGRQPTKVGHAQRVPNHGGKQPLSWTGWLRHAPPFWDR